VPATLCVATRARLHNYAVPLRVATSDNAAISAVTSIEVQAVAAAGRICRDIVIRCLT